MQRHTYMSLLSQARSLSRRADEAEDLLHNVLMAAVAAGRTDLSTVQNRRWLFGALRNRAAFEARSALRRRAREAALAIPPATGPTDAAVPQDFVRSLPPALRITALLALTGHTRPEIRHLLNVTDATLRQRIAQIRQRWNLLDRDKSTDMPGLSGHLPFGLIRRALRPALTQPHVHLGSHDPDGHLFVLTPAHKTG